MAAITAYTDIISLSRAKNYLRIDDTLTEDDEEINSMIKAAFQFIERYTNHIFIARDFSQYVPPKIYNYPINSVTGVEEEMWLHYYQRNMDKLCEDMPKALWTTYNAGYTDTDQVPEDFIQAALQMIKVFYYESEKQVNSTLIPISVTQILDTYRRFV